MPSLPFQFRILVLHVQFKDQGGHFYCPPHASFDQRTGALVPIDVPVRTGKEKSAVTTYSNHFIAKIEVVPAPKNTVSKKAVQFSSVGPVPPAVAADSPAAAESPAPEYPADGDQILLNFSPLTTVTTLEYQRLTFFLCPSGPDNQQFSSTCHLPDVVDAKPPMELSTLSQQGPTPLVTYTADFKRPARLRKYSALISPSPVHMSLLRDNCPLKGKVDCSKMDSTQLQAQKHVKWPPPSDAAPPISPRDARSRLLRAAAIASAVKAAPRCIRAIPTFRLSRLAVRRGDRAAA